MFIEAGKHYVNRVGERIGPMRRIAQPNGAFVWFDPSSRMYTAMGKATSNIVPHEHDLIAEAWTPPPQPAEPNPLPAWNEFEAAPTRPAPMPPLRAVNSAPNYMQLATVFQAAHDQAAVGKGKERHANGRDFDRQPIMELGRMFGPGFAAGQAAKKAQEAMGMLSRKENDAAVRELLGAMNYLAACVMLVREA